MTDQRPEDRRERIERLAAGIVEAYHRDAIVRQCLTHFVEGGREYADALEEAVIALSADRSRLMKELVRLKAREVTS